MVILSLAGCRKAETPRSYRKERAGRGPVPSPAWYCPPAALVGLTSMRRRAPLCFVRSAQRLGLIRRASCPRRAQSAAISNKAVIVMKIYHSPLASSRT